MTLDELTDDIGAAYGDLGDSLDVSLDRETRHELAMLVALFDSDDADELVRRAVHMLLQSELDRGQLDFHLRQNYDVTYDKHLAGMTYDEMIGQSQAPPRNDVRRYQMQVWPRAARPAPTKPDPDDFGLDLDAADVAIAVGFTVAAIAVTVTVITAAMVDLEHPEEHRQSAVAEAGAEDNALAGDDHVGWGRDRWRGHQSTGSRYRVGERPWQAR